MNFIEIKVNGIRAIGHTYDCITWDFVYDDATLAFTLAKVDCGFVYEIKDKKGYVSNTMFEGDCHSVQDMAEWVLAQIQFGDNNEVR